MVIYEQSNKFVYKVSFTQDELSTDMVFFLFELSIQDHNAVNAVFTSQKTMSD